MKNYYRLGITNEGNLLFNNSETYHGIVIGGNFAALYKDWLAAFLNKLNKPFFIDPRTEVFALDLNNIKKDNAIRSSFQKLINYFDATEKNKYFGNKIKQGKLSPVDFVTQRPKKWNNKLVNILVNGTLSLQKNMLNLDTSSNKKSIKKYLQILEELDENEKPKNVEHMVSPYFYFSNTYSPWFEINVKLLEACVRKTNEDVFAVLCFDREVLGNKNETERIINGYKKAAGFLIWINNFYDIKAETGVLIDYYKFLKDLSKSGKPIINLYGGYFTPLLSKHVNIEGYSRGIALGEGRDVEFPATGGGAPNRYYLRLTHDYAVEENAIKVLAKNPDLRCVCKICKPLVNDIIKKLKPKNNLELSVNFFRRLKPQEFKSHFMQIHNSELNYIISDNPDLKKELQKEIKDAERKKLSELDVRTRHLERWHKSLP